ncbi:MAG TPA: cupin domain-containing protein [Thermoguttaceae bacterium]|nr:cupin domain-containing protein [Thermoguttaceae bacterium]
MEIKFAEDVAAKPVEMDEARGVRMRMLIGPQEDAPNFNMRMFEVDPGGHTPLHTHPWEHEVYVLEGAGVVREGTREHKIAPGSCVYVPPDEEHQFLNAGTETLRFLCLVPRT